MNTQSGSMMLTAAQAEPQVPRRGLQRGDCLAVASPRPRNQVVDRERLIPGGRAMRSPPEVARQRGEIRDVRFPASDRAARAARAVDTQGHVRELARDVVLATQQLAVDDDPDAARRPTR
jgi:hypothetical protein